MSLASTSAPRSSRRPRTCTCPPSAASMRAVLPSCSVQRASDPSGPTLTRASRSFKGRMQAAANTLVAYLLPVQPRTHLGATPAFATAAPKAQHRLTTFLASRSAPRSSRTSTTSAWPLDAATRSAVAPLCDNTMLGATAPRRPRRLHLSEQTPHALLPSWGFRRVIPMPSPTSIGLQTPRQPGRRAPRAGTAASPPALHAFLEKTRSVCRPRRWQAGLTTSLASRSASPSSSTSTASRWPPEAAAMSAVLSSCEATRPGSFTRKRQWPCPWRRATFLVPPRGSTAHSGPQKLTLCC